LSEGVAFARRWVQIATILRARGNKGEVLAELLTDFPDRLASLKELFLSKDGGEPQPWALRHFWIDRNHPRQGIFHFADSKSISEAEKLRGYDIFVPMEQRVELPAEKYYVTDLIGCTVFEIGAELMPLASPACEADIAPQVLGTVTDVTFTGEGVQGTPLLEIETAQGSFSVPLAEDICRRIDTVGKRIEVKLPEGLKDLNQAE
jgi:16S rRNA processing protein RimM